MSRQNRRDISGRLPLRRGMSEVEAAVYLSLSPSFFRQLVNQGVMPRPRVIGARRIWDIDELDAAFKALPRENNDDSIYDLKGADSWADYK